MGWFLQALPFIIQALGGAGQHFSDRNAINRQNRYNDPASQVARLREAGLPLSALDGTAQAGNQSNTPQSHIGETANEISKFTGTMVQRKQLELMEAQIEATKATTRKTNEEGQKIMNENQIYTMDPTAGDPVSYGARTATLETKGRELDNFLKDNERRLRAINLMIQEDLARDGTIQKITRQQLVNLALQTSLYRQQFRTIHAATAAANTLIDSMEKSGGKMTSAEAFFHQLLSGNMRSILPNLGTDTGIRN